MPLGVGQQANHLAERGLVTQFVGPDLEPAELVDRAGKNGVAFALVDRHALTGEHGLIDGRPPADHHPVDGDPLAGPDDHAIADGDLLGRDLDLRFVPDHARGPADKIEQLADRALGTLEGERLQALADEGDEHDLGGDEIFAQAGRRDARDRQGDVGADRTFEQGRQGAGRPPARRRSPPPTKASGTPKGRCHGLPMTASTTSATSNTPTTDVTAQSQRRSASGS